MSQPTTRSSISDKLGGQDQKIGAEDGRLQGQVASSLNHSSPRQAVTNHPNQINNNSEYTTKYQTVAPGYLSGSSNGAAVAPAGDTSNKPDSVDALLTNLKLSLSSSNPSSNIPSQNIQNIAQIATVVGRRESLNGSIVSASLKSPLSPFLQPSTTSRQNSFGQSVNSPTTTPIRKVSFSSSSAGAGAVSTLEALKRRSSNDSVIIQGNSETPTPRQSVSRRSSTVSDVLERNYIADNTNDAPVGASSNSKRSSIIANMANENIEDDLEEMSNQLRNLTAELAPLQSTSSSNSNNNTVVIVSGTQTRRVSLQQQQQQFVVSPVSHAPPNHGCIFITDNLYTQNFGDPMYTKFRRAVVDALEDEINYPLHTPTTFLLTLSAFD